MRRCALVFLAVFVVLSAVVAQAVPTVSDYGPFTVSFYNNGDTNDYGLGWQDWTAGQMADVAASIQGWDYYINNTAGRQINMHIFWTEFGTSGGDESILGGAFSPSNGDSTTAWSYPEHIWRDGINYDGQWDGWDLMIELDITAGGVAWNFGSGAPSGSEIDFRSVVVHEIGHSLGFVDTYDHTPSYDDWGNTWGSEDSPYDWAGYNGLTEWDKNLVDQSGNRPAVDSKGTPGNFDEEGDVYFTGTNAVAFFGDDVPVYSPDTYSGGSSLSHLDEGVISPDALMSPFLSLGEMVRGPSDLELAVMTDMGWDVIPEPASVLLLVLGLSLLVSRKRRRI